MATFALGIKDMSRGNATEVNRYPQARGRAYAASWRGGIEINTFVKDGTPWAEVSFMSWQGEGSRRMIYRGPMSGCALHGDDVRLITMSELDGA